MTKSKTRRIRTAAPVLATRAPRGSSRPSAVGAYIFAGGFSVGVARHFDVRAHFEDGPFGVATAKRNFPGIEVFEDPDSWPTERYRGVGLVYCNPPCAPWSSANGKAGGHWRTDPRVSCVARCFDLLGRMRPDAWTFESVRGAYVKGTDMIREMTAKAQRLGYSVTHLLTDAVEHGTPQVRRRFLFVASKHEVEWTPTGKEPSVAGDVLGSGGESRRPESGSDVVYPMFKSLVPMVGRVPPGEKVRVHWDRIYRRKVEATPEGEPVRGRPSFLIERIDPTKPGPTLTGSATKLHPTEDRFISIAEGKRLSGFPPEFEFVGSCSGQYSQLAKGLMPPVAEYVAGRVAAAIGRGRSGGRGAREVWVYRDRVEEKDAFALPDQKDAARERAAGREEE